MTAQRLVHLDGLRGLAAFAVFACHFIQVFLPHVYYSSISEGHELYEQEFATSPFNIVVNGNFAVCLFFVLSGYVLSARFLQNHDVANLRRLAAKRYLRLALPALAAVLLAWTIQAFNGYSFGEALPVTKSGMKDTYATLLSFPEALWQGAIGAFFRDSWSLDPVLWTMQAELSGSFLVFAMLALFSPGRRRCVVYGIAILVFYNGYYLAFVLGVVLADLHVKHSGKDAPFPLILALLTLGIYFGSYPYYGAQQNIWAILPDVGSARKAVFYHIIGAFIIIFVTCRFSEARYVLTRSPFRFLGRISYSLYLVHFPLVCSLATSVLLALLPQFGYGGATAASLIVSTPLVLATATLFTVLVDEPATRLSDRFANLLEPRSPATLFSPADGTANHIQKLAPG
ncbi:MAG: acyltransferase [Rhodospirillaceae bacterium]